MIVHNKLVRDKIPRDNREGRQGGYINDTSESMVY